MDKHIRIAIADDHPVLREGLRRLLEAEGDFDVVGEAYDGHEALEVTRRLMPDVLLLDVAMPGLPGLEVLRALTASSLPTRIILLTANIGQNDIVKALQLGTRGVVMKDSATQVLMKAIRSVMAGEYWVGPDKVAGLVETIRADVFRLVPRRFGLTPRELEIVAAVTGGYTNKEIARRFALSEETVKHHLTKIYGKVHVANRLELALFAFAEHLIDPP